MSRYTVYVVPDEFRSIKRLPGNVRQRVRHAIWELVDQDPLVVYPVTAYEAPEPGRKKRR